MQIMLKLVCGITVGQAEAAVQQVEVVEAMAEDANIQLETLTKSPEKEGLRVQREL